MSTFTHINQSPVFNDVLKTTVPARWEHLVSDSLTSTKDFSLRGIARVVYGASASVSPVHGEVWTALPKALRDNSAEKTFKVTAGSVQMYVLSGAGSVTKNGQTIFLHDGEKVSFGAGDAFAFPKDHDMRLLVRNEGASFEEGTYARETAKLRPPTDAEVERLRAELGVTSTPISRSFSHYRRDQEPTSSSRYARSKVG